MFNGIFILIGFIVFLYTIYRMIKADNDYFDSQIKEETKENNMIGEPVRSFTVKYEVQIEVSRIGLTEHSARVKAFDLVSYSIQEGSDETSISSIKLLSSEGKI